MTSPEPPPEEPGEAARVARQIVVAGHRGDSGPARANLSHPDGAVRARCLGALDRLGALAPAEFRAGLGDTDPRVRRRACELAADSSYPSPRPLLADPDRSVAETAAWALGERGEADAVEDLSAMAVSDPDPLCREAAVAALGSIGDRRGLAAILRATTDRPAVRRRAVIALAPFGGPEVDAALRRALEDRDWQVRQAAEELTDEGAGGS